MATEFGSIDDQLMSGKNETQPAAPENQYEEPEVSYDLPEDDHMNLASPDVEEPQEIEEEAPEAASQSHETAPEEIDDYGNEKPKPRTFTEEEVNEMFRKRFKNKQQEQPNVQQQQQIQQQVQGFEYNPDAQGNWQQQLEAFVEHTFDKMSQRQANEQQVKREEQAQAEFQYKFDNGRAKFNDFVEVVGNQPVTDHMAMALRGFKDPASFIYAASKRHPQELQRISQIPDRVTQMVEMGKLEERMRKTAQATKAPRPIARTREDAGLPMKDKKSTEPSIEDLIAKAEQRKMAKHMQRKGGGR